MPSCSRCSRCESRRVTCTSEYFTTGGDMEHVNWTHTCQDCGHVDSDIQQACYGYDNRYFCALSNCVNRYPHQAWEGTRIAAIIFDWHGVLDHMTYRGFSKFLAGITGKDADWIRGQVSAREQQYIKSEISPSVFWEDLEKTLDLTSEQLAQTRAHLLTVQLNQELWAQLSALKERYKLAVLSDCPSDKLAVIRKTVTFEHFDVAQFSCESGMGKASYDFFFDLCERLGTHPLQCLYVDDTDKHVRMALGLGFVAHQFVTAAEFSQALQE